MFPDSDTGQAVDTEAVRIFLEGYCAERALTPTEAGLLLPFVRHALLCNARYTQPSPQLQYCHCIAVALRHTIAAEMDSHCYLAILIREG